MQVQIREDIKRVLLQWLRAVPTEDRVASLDDGSIVAATAKNAREDNQDRAFFARYESPLKERAFSLCAVLDGMGGMLDGGRCAEVAIASLLADLVSLPRAKGRIAIIEALNIANREVFAQYGGRGGTTFAGLYVDRQGARSVNIGDSRVYLFEPSKGLNLLSSDDRLGDQFAKIKGLEHVTLDPSIAGQLGQHLGMAGNIRPNVRLLDESLMRRSDGSAYISTDGAHSLGEDELNAVFRAESDSRGVASRIIEISRSSPSGDNATLISAKLRALIGNGMPEDLGYAKLTVWSPLGIFNYVSNCQTQLEPQPPTPNKDSSSKPWKKKKSKPQRHVPIQQQTDVVEKKAHEENAAAGKVIIEQLTFEPLNVDEPSE